MANNKIRFIHRADIQNALEAIAMLERPVNAKTDEQRKIESAYWQGYRQALDAVKIALVGRLNR
jgi:hypothetical protein